MARLKIRFLLAILTLTSSFAVKKSTATKSNPDVSWDSSSIDLADYHPAAQLGWSPRLDDSSAALKTRSIGDEKRRERRDLPPEVQLEKIAASKSVREARLMGSPESWAKQPLAVQFRPRPGGMEQPLPLDRYDDETDEAANLPPLIRAHYAPKTDFVTSGRARGPVDGRPPPEAGRESREMPIARSYDEYDVPIFRNVVREHDFDVQLPRNYYYPNPNPNRYRSQRDYYYRGAASAPPPNPYPYDRYREEDEDYEMYSRYNNRPTPKPKRIIYYATLPEIVRKPVDLRNYQRPYEPMARAPEAHVDPERPKPVPNNIEPTSRRPLRYPYDNYDNYVKRSSYYDRRRTAYMTGNNEDRARDEERSRGGMKEKIMRSDDRKLDNGQIGRQGNDRRVPWPVQIGAEVNVKDSERISGRKIYGQVENYDRYDGSRIKKDNAERKEDVNQDSNDNSNNNSDRNININGNNNN